MSIPDVRPHQAVSALYRRRLSLRHPNRFIKVAFRIVQHRFAFLRRDWRWRSDRRGGIAYRYRPGTGQANNGPTNTLELLLVSPSVSPRRQWYGEQLDREYPG